MPEPEAQRAPAWTWPLSAALIAVAPHLPVMLGRAEIFYDDHRRFSVPLGGLAAEMVCRGELPTWNPYAGLGAPLLADPQALALYPGLRLACVLPISHALGLLFVLHLGLLAAGVAALLRALGARPALAVAAGAALALCGPAPSWLTSGPYLITLSFFPWILLFAWRLGQGEDRLTPALLLGLALGTACLGGDLPGALVAGAVATALVLAAGGRRCAPALLGAGALALLVGAATWAPLAWYLGRSVRAGGLAGAEAGRWSMHPAEWVGLFVPHPAGLPLPENTFWPFGWVKQPRLFVHSWYVSGLLAVAGVWGALTLRRERPIRVLALAALALLIVASGSTTPLWYVLRPLFTFLRYPSKVAPYAVVLLAVIGALALSRALAERAAIRLAGTFAAAAGLGALLLPLVQSRLARAAGADPEQIVAAAAQLRGGALTTAALAGLAALVLWLQRRPAFARRAPALLAAIVIVDAAAAGASLWWTTPAPRPFVSPTWLKSDQVAGPRILRAGELDQVQLHRDETGYLQNLRHNENLLQPNTNVVLGASVLEGYGLALGDVLAAMSRLYQRDPVLLAELTGTDFLLAPRHPIQHWMGEGLGRRRLGFVATLDDGAFLLRPRRALPRAYTTARPALFDDKPARDAVAVVPAAWSPTAMRFDVQVAAPSLLVVTDAFCDGWHASVDGAPAPIQRAHGFMRAVAVPAGAHTVAMWFDVPLFRWAARGPLVGASLALALLAVHLRRRRRA